jgi:hypothetical protein
MRLGLGGQSSGHFSPASPEPAPKPAEQPSHPAWQSGNTAGFLTRPTRDQQPRRRVPARATGAAELGQAGPICSEVPDEGREVREMCGWDLCGAREMLQAVHRKGPRRTLPEDLSDPGLLGAGEHGGRYRIRTVPRGPNRVSSPSRAHKEPEWATARGLVPPTRSNPGRASRRPPGIEEREQLTRELARLAEAVAAGGQLPALGGWPKCCKTSKAPAKSSLLSSLSPSW